MRLFWPLVLFATSVAAAIGAPAPAEVLLLDRDGGALQTALALVAAWLGFSVGDAISFLLWRNGLTRLLPERWRAKSERLSSKRIDARFVAVSRLLVGSGLVNIAAAAGTMPFRRFLGAAAVGEIFYAVGILVVGDTGAELLGDWWPYAIGAAVVAYLAWVGIRSVRGRDEGEPAPTKGAPAGVS